MIFDSMPNPVQAVEELRSECAALDSIGRKRKAAAVAWSLQRYLIFALLSCIPGRPARLIRSTAKHVGQYFKRLLWYLLKRSCKPASLPQECDYTSAHGLPQGCTCGLPSYLLTRFSQELQLIVLGTP